MMVSFNIYSINLIAKWLLYYAPTLGLPLLFILPVLLEAGQPCRKMLHRERPASFAKSWDAHSPRY